MANSSVILISMIDFIVNSNFFNASYLVYPKTKLTLNSGTSIIVQVITI